MQYVSLFLSSARRVWIALLLSFASCCGGCGSDHSINDDQQPVTTKTLESRDELFLGNSGPAPAAPDHPAIYRKVYVLAIGIDTYKSSSVDALKWGVADAKALAATLATQYGYKTEVLLGPDAAKANVLAAIKRYRDSLDPDDSFIMFFAGHGETVPLDEFGRAGFLVPWDAELSLYGRRDIAKWQEEAIDMRVLGDLLTELRCRHVLLFADACYSGFFGRRSGSDERTDLSEMIMRPSRMVMTAGTEKQQSFEREEVQHGLFTYSLLSVLNSTAPQSTTEVFVKTRRMVADLSSGAMLPQLRHLITDNGEFVFLPRAIAPEAIASAMRTVSENTTSRATRSTSLEDLFEAYVAADPWGNARYHPSWSTNAFRLDREWKTRLSQFSDNASVGDPLAMAALYFCYAHGLGTDIDKATAFNWAQVCYDSEHPTGAFVLGHAYLTGTGVEMNFGAAERLLGSAAADGVSFARTAVAHLKMGDDPDARQIVDILNIYKEASKSDPVAAVERASLYLQIAAQHEKIGKNDVDSWMKGAVEFMRGAAEMGHAPAAFNMFLFHTGVADELRAGEPYKDLVAGHKWLLAAAEAGHAEAQLQLGKEYFEFADEVGTVKQALDLKPSPRRAFQWLSVAAEHGHPEAGVLIAYQCYLRKDSGRDIETARKYCDKAFDAGVAGAYTLQGIWMIRGDVMPLNIGSGLARLQQGAAMGDAHGIYYQGVVIETGHDDVLREFLIPSETSMARAVQAYVVADQMGHTAARDAIRKAALDEMNVRWLEANDKQSLSVWRQLHDAP